MNMRIILTLFVAYVFISSCKPQKASEEVIKPITNFDSIELVQSIDESTKEIDTLKLPIKGGDELMIYIFENKIKGYEGKFKSDNLKSTLCTHIDEVLYYSLPAKDNIRPIIIFDECGDNNQYILATHRNGKIIDFVLIYQYWEDTSDEVSKMKVIDFEILKGYDILITTEEHMNGVLNKKIKQHFRINNDGTIGNTR